MSSSPLIKESMSREQVAAEVLELGEALFDSLFEAATTHASDVVEDKLFPAEEMNEAARQFFTALRLLLNLGVP